MNDTQQAIPRARLLARRLPVDFSITTGFNLVIALVLTYLIRLGSSFYENLVFSLCIGSLVMLFIDGGRLLIWGTDKPPKLPFILLLAVATPAGWYLGVGMATRILGIAPENFTLATARSGTGFFLFFTLTCASITWFFWNRGRLQLLAAEAEAEKARAAAIEKQAMQAQLQMLQAQIEPHMLFNTLANLQSLIAVDPQRAQHMLDQLIQYLRATLSSSRAETTSLAQEFSLMSAYLGLMKVRMGARLSYALDLPDALSQVMVPPMLLQPLVENAVKHGLEPKLDGGEVFIRAASEGAQLTLTVTDTGLGLDAAPADGHGTRLGLANIRERLLAQYGERAAFSLRPNTPSGVTAQLILPLQT